MPSAAKSLKPAAGTQRPGGRTKEVTDTVASAVLRLISNGSIDFSYNELAAESGVHKTTLYRRWPQRIDLIREAIALHNKSFTLKPAKSWHTSAKAIVDSLAQFLSQPAEIAINRALLTEPDAAANAVTAEYWKPIRRALIETVRDAQARQEVAADLDPEVLMATLLSPMLLNTLMSGESVDKKLIKNLIKIARSHGLPQ